MTIEPTTLSILTKDTTTGDHDCIVLSQSPLWIKELIICPIDNLAAPSGRLPPGNAPNGSLRTLCLNSTHEVFTTAAPFNLSVTYDTNNNYRVSEAHVVHPMQAVMALFGLVSEGLAELLPEQQAFFLAQVLQVVAPPLALPLTTLGGTCAPAASKSKSNGSEKGKDGYAPPSA